MTATSLTGDTIAAIATAVVPQQGSVGIVRVSGDEAVSIAKKLFHAPGSQPWESHRILYGFVKHPETGNTVDEALLLLMLAPKSYTREDVVEFHCHGGIIAVQQVLQLCLESGARLAQQGEFTLRAFLNGRLDLTQAESIAELVGAQSPAAAQSALAGLQGKLATPIRNLRSTCLDILAEIEARIDFEENLPPLDIEGIVKQIQGVNREVSDLLETADRGELLRSGLKVAIVGRPNVGKSSLLNAWSRSDRAIVTELPGTTRDVVESQLVVQGIPVQVLDTAGIREASDQVEKMGVQRSREAAKKADLILLAIDAQAGWTQEDAEIYYNVNQRPVILVVNKVDLLDRGDKNQLQEIENAIAGNGNFIQIIKTAAAKPEGIDRLENAIAQAVHTGNLQAADTDLAINQRQAAALTRAKNALEQVQKAIADDLPLDFWTIDLREATQAFGEVTGDEITESMLDRIFSRFCIGK